MWKQNYIMTNYKKLQIPHNRNLLIDNIDTVEKLETLFKYLDKNCIVWVSDSPLFKQEYLFDRLKNGIKTFGCVTFIIDRNGYLTYSEGKHYINEFKGNKRDYIYFEDVNDFIIFYNRIKIVVEKTFKEYLNDNNKYHTREKSIAYTVSNNS